ncbi:MAG: hypothetical protein ACR2PI_27210 [Hyphomicrobiaceae bacterium]
MLLQRVAAKRPNLKSELRILGQGPTPMRSLKQSVRPVGETSETSETSETGETRISELVPMVVPKNERPGSLLERLPFGLGRLFKGA